MTSVIDDLERRRELVGEVRGYDPPSLAAFPNLVLRRGDNVALFEYEADGVYQGHYLFRNKRTALRDSRDILREVFEVAEVIKGLTPFDNSPALRMTEALGFTSYGDVDTELGPMRLSILTKKEYMNE